MPSTANDRNMLFGILALQMDFIRRDALIAAMNAWVLEKQKPLGQILLDQKALTPETHALLDALVQKHLEVHGNNIEKSLAAISSVGPVRQQLEQIADADVQASLVHLPTTGSREELPGATISFSAGNLTSKGLRFRILRPHAKGGLGMVYVAHDEELNRDVALKEIQDRHSQDEQSRARFLLEAEITGGLEHPSIVPVYGLGQYADGRPFYAMRFIRGDSLKDAIAKFHQGGSKISERPVEFREMIERLIDVCNAIQYAHDRGVLHRDLKPGNIMLGRYGETLVVDWGLAKPLGRPGEADSVSRTDEPVLRPSSVSGSAETMQGSAVGTPQYMSPEQAAGKLDQLGPASDIYSLGATLYSLLTGKSPADDSTVTNQKDADLAKVLKKVQTGAIKPPREINPEISPALEAICLKAMALNPQHRYASPNAIVDDLKHWLADEPVSAWPEPWSVKARRWVNKHRTFVTGAAAALVVGVVSLSLATILLAQANDTIQKKNDDLTNANETIKKQNDDIKKEVAEKEKQRKLAESRLKQSLDAVGLFANDARKYCDDAMVPGQSRRRLYEVLIAQLERQVDQEPGEAAIDSLRNKVWMYQTLCAVTSDFGEYGKSKAWFDKGVKTVSAWEKFSAADPVPLSFRATLLHLQGTTFERLQQRVEARQLYAQALAIRRKLAGDATLEAAEKGKSFAMLADSLDSVEQFEESLKLREQVANLHENDKEAGFPHREAWCWTLQKAALDANDYGRRKALFIKADEMSEALHRERPSNRNILLRWAVIAKMFGELEHNFGKLAEKDGKEDVAKKYYVEAERHYKRLNDISKKLATSSELVQGLRDYSRSYYTLGLVEELNGNAREARQHFQTSRDIRQQTIHDYANEPISAHLQIDLLFSEIATGDFDRALNMADNLVFAFLSEPEAQYRLACIFALSINAIAEARKGEPLTAKDKQLQIRCLSSALRCLQAAHDGGFSDFFQTSIDADFEALRDDPAMKEFEASHHYRLGAIAKKHGEADKARGHFARAKEIAEVGMKSLRNDPRHKHVEIISLCARVQLGEFADPVQEADRLRLTLGKRDTALFRLARVYSLASAIPADPKAKEELRGKALATLEQAVEVGRRQTLLLEDDLEPVRNDPRFQQTLRLYTDREKK